MSVDGWIEFVELRRRLATTTSAIERWAHLAPSIDRAGERVRRDEAILIALAVRLRQHGLTAATTRTTVGRLLATVDRPAAADWVVVTDGPKRATVHVGGVVDLDRRATVQIVDAGELRLLLDD